ncbi:hypothetical protein VTO73DRAFT_10100 [Trametes versicolor]
MSTDFWPAYRASYSARTPCAVMRTFGGIESTLIFLLSHGASEEKLDANYMPVPTMSAPSMCESNVAPSRARGRGPRLLFYVTSNEDGQPLNSRRRVPSTTNKLPRHDRLSQEQANEIHALKTQIAGFSAQITSLTAQVAAQKDQICLLEQDPGCSSGTASQDRQAVKLEDERGIPAEDPGRPRPLAAALPETNIHRSHISYDFKKLEDLNPAIPIQAVVDPASRAFALSDTDVAISTLSGAPFLKKERLGGGSTDGAERAQSGSQLAKLKEAVTQVMREDGRDEQSYTKVTGVVSNAARGGPDKVLSRSSKMPYHLDEKHLQAQDEIASLKTEVAELHARLISLRVAPTGLHDALEGRRTTKLEESDIGIPAEDPGKLSRWAAQVPLRESKKEEEDANSQVLYESQAEVVMDSASRLTGSGTAAPASPRASVDDEGQQVGSGTLEVPPYAVVAARSKDLESIANQPESGDMRSTAKRVRPLPEDATSQSSKRIRQSTPSPEPSPSSDHASTIDMPVAPCFGPYPQLVYGENVASGFASSCRRSSAEHFTACTWNSATTTVLCGTTSTQDASVDRAHMLEPTRSHYWHSYELLFAGAGQEWPGGDEGPRHLMVSSSVDGPDEKYVYRGEYSFTRTYLSRFFEDLEDEEKKWWGGLIATGSQREGLSRNPRAEIWLRKLQRRTVGVTEYVDAASEGFPMTAEEVVEAYEEGLLPLKTWRLIKEGYRVGFQRRLVRELSALQDCDSDDDPWC